MIETHIHTPSCKIQAIEDGHEVGLLEFEIHENILTITHTYAYQKGHRENVDVGSDCLCTGTAL